METIGNVWSPKPARDAGAVRRAWAEGGDGPEEAPAREEGVWEMRRRSPKASLYRDCEAVRAFRALYTGNRRRDPRAWMDYFTSGAFLDVMREPGFTAALLEAAEAAGEAPSREFAAWLSAAYQFTMEDVRGEDGERGRQFRFLQGAAFEGVEDICRLAAGAPMPKRLQGNELAMLISFFEYNRLLALAAEGWSDEAVEEAGRIIGRYVTAYLQDKCTRREWNNVERHPAGVRLLAHFFRRGDLPEELCRDLWNKLDLKSAVLGRSGVLYKDLRELVLERVPGIGDEEPENFLQLNRAHDAYAARVRAHPEEERAETEAFFAREDFQKALRSRRFVEEQLLRYGFWLSPECPAAFLLALEDCCREHPDIPCARQIRERVGRSLRDREIRRANREDREAPVGGLTFHSRPFLRHWLNTGFYTARHPEDGRPLTDYLEENLPYSPDWSRRFFDERPAAGRTVSAVIQGARVEALYHRRYIEYRVDGQPVYYPCLPWELLAEQEGETFFHLLPMAAAFCGQYGDVRSELLRRLGDTAAPEADRPFLAACLAEHVCRLPVVEGPEDDPLASLPLELFAEDGGRLYGASWHEGEGTLRVFEQTSAGRRDLPGGQYGGVFDAGAALSMARRLLEEAMSPAAFHLSLLKELPQAVYASPHDAAEQVYKRKTSHELSPEVLALKELLDQGDPEDQEDIRRLLEREGALDDEASEEDELDDGAKELTEEILEDMLNLFGSKKLRRLELDFGWYKGSLTLLSGRSGYACLFFEHCRDTWYAMLSQPEVYRTVEHTDVKHVPFGMGKLPEYSVHKDPASIMGNLDLVFAQLGRGRPQTREGDRWLWSAEVNLHDGKHKFLMAKQKLGGFPPERGRNYLLAKFVLKEYPVRLESETLDGERTLADIKSGTYGMAANALVQFMQKKLARLRLSWRAGAGDGAPCLRHIVLLQDGGRFMMAWLRDDAGRAEFYVADERAYMDVEGKKYPRDVFLGRTVPAYLVHGDLQRIRNCLDLMLDGISDCAPVVNQFAQFAGESPVKPRPYAEIRRELVREAEA